jgi:hypothetical protein
MYICDEFCFDMLNRGRVVLGCVFGIKRTVEAIDTRALGSEDRTLLLLLGCRCW